MLSVYKRVLFLFCLFLSLVSIFVFNLFTVLDSEYKNKTIFGDICHQLKHTINLNYTLNQRLINKRPENDIKRDLINDNNVFETSFVNISDNIFIYSAFEKSNNFIVLIGFAKNSEEVNEDYNFYNYNNSYKVEDYHYFCDFGKSILIKTSAVVQYLPESHDYYYSAIKVECKRPQLFDQNLAINRVKLIQRPKQLDKSRPNDRTIESDFVFIVNNNKRYKSYGLVKSQQTNGDTDSDPTPRPSSASTKELVVCVRPLFGNISAINLLEFIAYYRLNGIKSLVFYNSINGRNMSKPTKQLFDLLSSMDFVEVLPFIIPNNEESRPIIHANGQLVAIHDCLYRFQNKIQIHVDFDEYLIAFKNKTLKQFLLSEDYSQSSALVVPTVLFCNEFNQQLAKRSDPLLITGYNRQKTIWPHEIRSKVIIINAVLITQMGIHSVWQLSPIYSQQKSRPIRYSSPNELLIYHYRKCCDMSQPYIANIIHFHPINDYMVRDESMKGFANRVKQFIDKYIEVF